MIPLEVTSVSGVLKIMFTSMHGLFCIDKTFFTPPTIGAEGYYVLKEEPQEELGK